MSHAYFAKAIDVEGCNPYGNAILSRIPFKSVETIPIPDPERRPGGKYYETRCLLKAKLVNGLTVLVTHFGLNPEEQENAVATVLANLEEEKCVLMGDFNLTPDSPLLAPIRARMKDTADLFPQEKGSFPSDAPRCKIDYIFVTPDLCTLSADIPAIVASDHRPHVAEISFLQ
jgi:endonuclease/exonuclease/phosphatase family metal-dependent hydrolase